MSSRTPRPLGIHRQPYKNSFVQVYEKGNTFTLEELSGCQSPRPPNDYTSLLSPRSPDIVPPSLGDVPCEEHIPDLGSSKRSSSSSRYSNSGKLAAQPTSSFDDVPDPGCEAKGPTTPNHAPLNSEDEYLAPLTPSKTERDPRLCSFLIVQELGSRHDEIVAADGTLIKPSLKRCGPLQKMGTSSSSTALERKPSKRVQIVEPLPTTDATPPPSPPPPPVPLKVGIPRNGRKAGKTCDDAIYDTVRPLALSERVKTKALPALPESPERKWVKPTRPAPRPQQSIPIGIKIATETLCHGCLNHVILGGKSDHKKQANQRHIDVGDMVMIGGTRKWISPLMPLHMRDARGMDEKEVVVSGSNVTTKTHESMVAELVASSPGVDGTASQRSSTSSTSSKSSYTSQYSEVVGKQRSSENRWSGETTLTEPDEEDARLAMIAKAEIKPVGPGMLPDREGWEWGMWLCARKECAQEMMWLRWDEDCGRCGPNAIF